MTPQKIRFDENEEFYLEAYCEYTAGAPRDALMIIPGGGYYEVSEREGAPVALAFREKGFNCFVLHYSVRENALFPRPLEEASAAMKYVKENAKKYNVDPDRVFVLGFSAGGHLAASLGILWHTVDIKPRGVNRPAGMVLCYPVITAKENECHEGSFKIILGTKELNDENRNIYSLEKLVDENTCPAYIYHTFADTVVAVQSALYLGLALKKHNVPFEMHVFPRLDHGTSLATAAFDKAYAGAENHTWVDEAAIWMRQLKK